jgi:hypothetical protein
MNALVKADTIETITTHYIDGAFVEKKTIAARFVQAQGRAISSSNTEVMRWTRNAKRAQSARRDGRRT